MKYYMITIAEQHTEKIEKFLLNSRDIDNFFETDEATYDNGHDVKCGRLKNEQYRK